MLRSGITKAKPQRFGNQPGRFSISQNHIGVSNVEDQEDHQEDRSQESTKPTLSKEQLVAIMKRVESGKSGLIAESLALGFNGSKPLHNVLTELLGSKEKYNAMLRRAIKARGEKKQPAKKQPMQKAPVQKEQPVEGGVSVS